MITVKIKAGFKEKNTFGSPSYVGDLFAVDEDGFWVQIDSCTSASFCADELSLPKSTTKEEIAALVDEDCDPIIGKQLVTSLLRRRRKS